ncbi:SDR family NAD(P)-dependent oxidoreductase [Catenovulum sp. SM1970]|uniref:SDR family NAD(P)-dependent oxidoreductase n=1 Tax=Marinifaba aquimaris TaxID=2741323 RepID=UPI001574CED2|nr:SDR family NAD(P)-dependent oxidoreductase [Marinifaba aquimaris]NTS76471.1 SDR family NAD(P)-dependent oxidoreductase [Marinifaba aquimaris]
MVSSIANKQVLITGASSGIGKALCLQYAELGCHVFACGRNEQRLASLVDQNSLIEPLIFDITNKAEVDTVFASLDKLDLVILNAGDCEYIDDALQFDSPLFERIIKTNLISVGYMLEAAIPLLEKNSQLALVSSSVTYLPLQRAEAYGASKAGMSYLAKSLSLDLKPHGIHVSLVEPGFVKTPLTDKNNFKMPFLISAEQAAVRIVQGLAQKHAVIHFPKRFTLILKMLGCLPFGLWQKLAVRTIKK